MICGPKVYEPTGFFQASNMWLSQWKKARVNLAFQVNQGFTKTSYFLAEVLYVISTFSTCPAVLQISRISECLMTQRYKKYKGTKKVEFCLSPVYSFTAQFLWEIKIWKVS